MDKLDDGEFVCHYQNATFKENESGCFAKANFKRYRMCLAFDYSSERLCNQTTCDLLEENLRSYIDLIDDRKGINNYAQATKELAGNIKNDYKLWKSNLSKNGPKVEDLLKPLPGDCFNKATDGSCTSSIPTRDDINALEKAYEQLKSLESEELTGSSENHKNSSQNYFRRDENGYKGKITPASTKQTIGQRTNFTKFYGGCTQKANRLVDVPSTSGTMETENSPPEAPSGIYFKTLGKNTVPKRSGRNLKHRDGQDSSNFEDDWNEMKLKSITFKTAGEQLRLENQKKFGNSNSRNETTQYASSYHPANVFKKSLGGKRSVSTKFVPPLRSNSQEDRYGFNGNNANDGSPPFEEEEIDERLKNIDPKMVELIKNEIMDSGTKVEWDDIAGLEFAKNTIQEIVVWPMLRPDIFTGLRRPPKGILLFGPPGTGKTLIGKCIASQSNATFFSISASSLTSKWIGDGEKMVRALFAVARVNQPSVVFIDEIDSLLSQRSDTEHESSRRIKTEFLVQLDGAATGEEERILVIGATNRPQELDEAARRRLVKRLYIPLPEINARKQLVANLMKAERNTLSSEEIDEIAILTDGYSGADMKNLCQEASLGPIRSIASTQMFQIKADQVRPVSIDDFKIALRRVRSSVSPSDLQQYLVWDKQYGFSGSLIE